MEGLIQELAAEVGMEKIRQARRMSAENKFRAGSELFEEACRWTMAGIAAQHPQMDEVARHLELRRRLSLPTVTAR